MRARWIGSIVAMVALMLGLAAGAATAAQGTATPAVVTQAHPAHVHEGTCEELGDVVYPLNDVSGEALSGTPSATPASQAVGQAGDVIARSTTTIDVGLGELLDGTFAVNVHKSAEEIDVYIACGNIVGEPVDGAVTVPLEPQNNSGIAGQAILVDVGDEKTEVTITLVDASTEGLGTPPATPAS